jgi:hypothetical protein
MSAIIAASMTVNSVDGELAQDDLHAEEHPGDGGVEGGGDGAAGAAGDQDPHSAFGHLDPLADGGGQRGADLHDRAFPADRPAHPDAHRRGDRLDHADLRPDPPAFIGDRDHHLGYPVPADRT